MKQPKTSFKTPMLSITYIVCKKDPDKTFQYYSYLCVIYSKCGYCGVDTSYTGVDLFEHFDVYQYPYKRWTDKIYDIALDAIKADSEKYHVKSKDDMIDFR